MTEFRCSYYIEVEEIRPLGEYRFAAKAVFDNHCRSKKWPIPLPTCEYWGKTKDEARNKVRHAVSEWANKCSVVVTESP